jgi:hypothetical protein
MKHLICKLIAAQLALESTTEEILDNVISDFTEYKETLARYKANPEAEEFKDGKPTFPGKAISLLAMKERLGDDATQEDIMSMIMEDMLGGDSDVGIGVEVVMRGRRGGDDDDDDGDNDGKSPDSPVGETKEEPVTEDKKEPVAAE